MKNTILPGSFLIADPSGSFLKVSPASEIIGRVLFVKINNSKDFPPGLPVKNYSVIEIIPEDSGKLISCFSDNNFIPFEKLEDLKLEAKRILIGIEGLLVMGS
jgi:hypothetical protein